MSAAAAWLLAAAWPATAAPGGPVPAAAAPASPLAALDAGFTCPEALRSDAERAAALRAFVDGYARLRPDATPTDMLDYRRVLLEKHGCARTLAHIDAADRAVAAGDVQRQAWLPIATLDGATLAMSTDHVRVVLDRHDPPERAVEAWARLMLAAPAQTSATRVRYDQVVSYAIYYCASHRYALVANVFFLAGRQVATDAGEIVGRSSDGAPVFAVADLPPGSPNEQAGRWACATAKGDAT